MADSVCWSLREQLQKQGLSDDEIERKAKAAYCLILLNPNIRLSRSTTRGLKTL